MEFMIYICFCEESKHAYEKETFHKKGGLKRYSIDKGEKSVYEKSKN